MDIHGSAVLFSTSVGLLLLGSVWCFLFPRARREAFQQDLFQIRNDLFLFMRDRDYSFEDPAYRQTRDLLNGAIRVAERINLPMVVATAILNRVNRAKSEPVVESATGDLQKELKRAQEAIAFRVAKYLFFSPLGLVAFAVCATYWLVKFGPGVQMWKMLPVRAYMRRSREEFSDRDHSNFHQMGPALTA